MESRSPSQQIGTIWPWDPLSDLRNMGFDWKGLRKGVRSVLDISSKSVGFSLGGSSKFACLSPASFCEQLSFYWEGMKTHLLSCIPKQKEAHVAWEGHQKVCFHFQCYFSQSCISIEKCGKTRFCSFVFPRRKNAFWLRGVAKSSIWRACKKRVKVEYLLLVFAWEWNTFLWLLRRKGGPNLRQTRFTHVSGMRVYNFTHSV